jgi:hypothetical protein
VVFQVRRLPSAPPRARAATLLHRAGHFRIAQNMTPPIAKIDSTARTSH